MINKLIFISSHNLGIDSGVLMLNVRISSFILLTKDSFLSDLEIPKRDLKQKFRTLLLII